MTPESLLLLEDDALLAEQTRRAFARHGIEVHHAADLQQAHALLATLATLDAALKDTSCRSATATSHLKVVPPSRRSSSPLT